MQQLMRYFRWQFLQNIYAYYRCNPTCVWNKMPLWFWWFALLWYNGERSGRICPHWDWLCVLFTAVPSVFLKSSHFVKSLPTQCYYDLWSLMNKKLCRIWSRPSVDNRCLNISHPWNDNHYHEGWRNEYLYFSKTLSEVYLYNLTDIKVNNLRCVLLLWAASWY